MCLEITKIRDRFNTLSLTLNDTQKELLEECWDIVQTVINQKQELETVLKNVKKRVSQFVSEGTQVTPKKFERFNCEINAVESGIIRNCDPSCCKYTDFCCVEKMDINGEVGSSCPLFGNDLNGYERFYLEKDGRVVMLRTIEKK